MAKKKFSGTDRAFAATLLHWHRTQNTRQMPWKGEKDPYRIWLSEIILQQTRVEQGLAYYNRFVKAFPTISDLASARDEKVFKLWEGLGYYTRCRNLLVTARHIAREKNGLFPDSYLEIRALKGVGPYTAAAIASFAYNLPHAVVDGNVFRVLARVFGLQTPTDSTAGKKEFTELAESLLDRSEPGLYNQAIMDFGAVVCKPQAPLCTGCPFRKRCRAFRNDQVDQLPVREKKARIRNRWFHFFIFRDQGRVAIRPRPAGDIWSGLHDFPLIESSRALPAKKLMTLIQAEWKLDPGTLQIKQESAWQKQALSHQLIHGRFWELEAPGARAAGGKDWKWVQPGRLKQYAFPRLIRHYLDNRK